MMDTIRLLPIVYLVTVSITTLFEFSFSYHRLASGQTQSGMKEEIANFQLQDTDQRQWSLADKTDSKIVVVAFLGTECPLVKLYAKRLQAMHREFESNSITFVGINSNQQDSIAEIQHFVRSFEIGFPVLKDPGNRVADMFGAMRTPEVFVLDDRRKIVYRGTIDDQYSYGIQQSKAKNEYLRDALISLLAGQDVEVPETEAVGCIIGRMNNVDETSTVTYSNQISRLLQKNCVNCHRSGEIAPFALTQYNEVAGWAGMIEEVVREQRMPPWHADAPPGQFKNDIRLTEDEKLLIHQWVKAGAPEGEKSQLPDPIVFHDGWRIGKPDMIVKMRNRPFRVKATGTIDYKYFQVDPGFDHDMWVKAAECRPGNRSVVHHIIVGIGGQGEFGDREGVHGQLESEWLAATAPGAPPTVFPDGYAKFIPAGSRLVFQMHYTPNGTATTDLSQIGLIFAKPEAVRKRVITLMAFNERIKIRPGDPDYRLTATYRFERDIELMSMFPHMHYRGKAFSYEFKKPDDKYRKLLNVPTYDFNWQNSYELTQTVTIPKGTRLRCRARFDNSENNLANPDPTRTVRWGDQTWEEMMIGYFNVAVPIERENKPAP